MDYWGFYCNFAVSKLAAGKVVFTINQNPDCEAGIFLKGGHKEVNVGADRFRARSFRLLCEYIQ